jgi:hypothetical protein
VHAGTGGVGLAAVNVCQTAGAQLAASAGSAAKRTFLRRAGVPVAVGSRDAAFTEELCCTTPGECRTLPAERRLARVSMCNRWCCPAEARIQAPAAPAASNCTSY